jgi:protein phosphatase 2C family protein 2/3
VSEKGKAVAMSEDHKPDCPDEKRRIERAGGFVEDNRVKGVLNLSRCLGDLEYKLDPTLKPNDQMLTATPDIRYHKISPDTDFLILACDGIWDCLTNQEAVNIVHEKKQGNDKVGKATKYSELAGEIFEKIIAADVQSS